MISATALARDSVPVAAFIAWVQTPTTNAFSVRAHCLGSLPGFSPGGGGVAAGRGARLSGGSPAAALHSEADERFQQHLMLMREQDDELDALGDQARRVGHIGREIGGELELQGQILDKLEDETDVTRNRLRGVTSKVSDLLKKNDKCQWIVAGVLLLLLILLTVALFH